MGFGDWLKEMRLKRQLSRKELAEPAGITESTVYQIERGKIKNPPDVRLKGFAKALKISLDVVKKALKGVFEQPLQAAVVSGLLIAPNLNLFGLDELEQKILNAIEVVQYYEPHALSFNPAGYSCEFSGGKDSLVVEDIMRKAGVKHETNYSMTTIDPPELIYFMRDYYPEVNWRKPKENFFNMVLKKGLPTRLSRWCCDCFKERNATDSFVVTGIRAAESTARSKRRQFESCRKYHDRRFIHPAFNLTEKEVWEYIRREDLPYCSLYDEGFKRLGCIGCPMGGKHHIKREFDRWPGFAKKWKQSAIRFFDLRKGKAKWTSKFTSGEEFFNWWLRCEAMPKEFTDDLGLNDAKGFYV